MRGPQGADFWYVRRDGRVLGPFDALEIAYNAKLGRLLGSDALWTPALDDWHTAASVPGLLVAESPMPPPVPVAQVPRRVAAAPAPRVPEAPVLALAGSERPVGDGRSRLQAIADWTTAAVGRGVEFAGAPMSLLQLREQIGSVRWEPVFDRMIEAWAIRIKARSLRELLHERQVEGLTEVLLEHIPMSARYALLLTIGRKGIEHVVRRGCDNALKAVKQEFLDGDIRQTLPALIGSGALKQQAQWLGETLKADALAAFGRIGRGRVQRPALAG
jgi:hypothetical protein